MSFNLNRPKEETETTATLYQTDIHILESHEKEWTKRLTKERRAKMERYRGREDRLRSLAAGLLLDRAFGKRAAEIRRGKFGKPFFENGPFFNLSHSGSRVVLAVSPSQPIGCDIQHWERIRPKLIVKHIFHPMEYDLYQKTAESDRRAVFYRIWTLKESYLKMIGKGVSLAPNRFHFELTPTIRILELPKTEPSPFFFLSETGDGYTLAICSLSNLDEIHRIEITDWGE